MKKLVVILLLSIVSISSVADNFFLSEYRYSRIRKNQIFVELSGGNDAYTDEFGASLGIGFRHHFCRYIAWDALTVKAMTAPKYFFETESSLVEMLTGVRVTSPEILPVYLSGKCGGALPFTGGFDFAFELGAGLNLSNHVSVGYAYNNIEGEGLHMLQLGFSF